MALTLTTIDPTQLSPIAARAVGPNAVGPARMMAARGLVPMGPKDLVTVLYQLHLDKDPIVAAAAKEAAATLPDAILANALGEPLDARVLHYFAGLVTDRAPLVQKVLINPRSHDETMLLLAAVLDDDGIEILATNQERMLRFPALIEAIYLNKQARMSTVERLLEMAVRNGITLDRIPQFKTIAAAILGAAPAPPKPATQVAAEDQAFASTMSQGWEEGPQWDLEVEQQTTTGDSSVSDLLRTPLQEIPKLLLVRKLRLAAVGSTMHRAILIRDSNRQVALTAVNSDNVSEQEAAQYAANRSLPEDVIREIAKRKEFQRNYLVKVNLVNNPKCPLSHSMHFLPHLRPNDLRAVATSKNISSVLAAAAREQLRARGPGKR